MQEGPIRILHGFVVCMPAECPRIPYQKSNVYIDASQGFLLGRAEYLAQNLASLSS